MENKEKIKVNIGLDIGVASVGWSIIGASEQDETNKEWKNKIWKLGVRLFDDVANPKDGRLGNAERRDKRAQRRRLRRTNHRKERFINFLVKKGWVDSYEEGRKLISEINISEYRRPSTNERYKNPIEIRVDALNYKIDKKLLIFLLFHYLHHRGVFHITEIEQLDENNKITLQSKLPCELIMEQYESDGWYKGSEITKNIPAILYKNEIEKISKKQEIEKEFIEEYIDNLFLNRRDFETGPGDENSPTPYGMYYLDENGKVAKRGGDDAKTLWDALIGKCTYYPSEKRGFKHSPIAEMFNLLNDISNIRFFKNSEYKLDAQFISKIFDSYNENERSKKPKKSYKLDPKKLLEIGNNLIINEQSWFEEKLGGKIPEIDNVDGYRFNSKNEKIITELSNYIAIVRWMMNTKQIDKDSINLFDISLLESANAIFEEIAKEQDLQKRIKLLNEKQINKELDEETKKEFENQNITLVKEVSKTSQTHSLSNRAMLEYINSFLDTSKNNNIESESDEYAFANQMQFFDSLIKKGKLEVKSKYNDESKYLKHFDSEAVISPTTRRAFNQTINVLNKIFKLYHDDIDIGNITIELARDKNVKEEKDKIKKLQQENRNKLVEIISSNENKTEKEVENEISKLNAAQIIRLKLWNEQDKRDFYDWEPISYSDAKSGFGLEVDHIIPYSISQDDSMDNKILTKSYNNKKKSNSTPYQWLSKSLDRYEFLKQKWEEYKVVKSKNKKDIQKGISVRKFNNLTFEGDPLLDFAGFIGRNLVDTRYASRLVLNELQSFFQNNEIKNKYGDAKIKVIRGTMTSFARNNLFVRKNKENKDVTILPKNRDVYCHHAIDASIVAYLGANHALNLMLQQGQKDIYFYERQKNSYDFVDGKKNQIIDQETGEVFDLWQTNDEVRQFGELLSTYNARYNKEENVIEYGDNSDKIQYSRMMVKKQNKQLSNETIYSFRWIDEKNGYIIDKLSLVDSDRKALDKYFSNNAKDSDLEKLYCYKNNKFLYDKLRAIYNQYSQDPKVNNPFVEYMIENKSSTISDNENKDINNKKENNFKWLEIDNLKLKYLKYIKSDKEKNIDDVIQLKYHSNKSSTNSHAILESLKWLSLRLYSNSKGEIKLVRINAKVLKFNKSKQNLEIDEIKLNKLLDELKIDNKSKFIEINRGTIFCHITCQNNNEKYYWCCGGQEGIIELKPISCLDELTIRKKERYLEPISTIVKNYHIVEMDELGNIYKRIPIKEYFGSK